MNVPGRLRRGGGGGGGGGTLRHGSICGLRGSSGQIRTLQLVETNVQIWRWYASMALPSRRAGDLQSAFVTKKDEESALGSLVGPKRAAPFKPELSKVRQGGFSPDQASRATVRRGLAIRSGPRGPKRIWRQERCGIWQTPRRGR